MTADQTAILEFNIAAWMKGSIGLGDDGREVAETDYSKSEVDVVKAVRIDPFIFGVVNFEAAVLGDV